MPLHSVWSRPRRRRRSQPALSRALPLAVTGAAGLGCCWWFFRRPNTQNPMGMPATEVGGDEFVPFVGREAELRVLSALTDQQRPFIPHRRVVGLRGPQAGKSRLLREHARRAQLEQPERTVVLLDCGLPVSSGSIEQRLLAVATGGSTSSGEGGAGEQQLRLHLTTLAEQQGVRVKLPLLIVDHLPPPPPLYPHPGGISAAAVLSERRRLLRGLEAVAAEGLACVIVCPQDEPAPPLPGELPHQLLSHGDRTRGASAGGEGSTVSAAPTPAEAATAE